MSHNLCCLSTEVCFLGNIVDLKKWKKNRVDRRAQDIFGQTTFIIVILNIQQTIKNKVNFPLE